MLYDMSFDSKGQSELLIKPRPWRSRISVGWRLGGLGAVGTPQSYREGDLQPWDIFITLD